MPDGWFDGDLLWFDRTLGPQTILSRGAHLRIPDLSSADEGTRDTYYEVLGSMFCQLGQDEAVKFQWQVNGDYHAELEAYRNRTRESGARGWCAAVREERYFRYQDLMARGMLRRQRLDIYFSKRCSSVPSGGLRSKEQVDRYIEQSAKNFQDKFAVLQSRMPGSFVEPMDDREHYAAWYEFMQPSSRLVGDARYEGFDPLGTILENTWPGGGITTKDPEGNLYFRMDGQYHALIVLRRWPKQTHMGIIWALTSALSGNYCYTLTCLPLSASTETEKTEKELVKLEGNRAHNKGVQRLDVDIERKRAKIHALQNGFARPFSALPVVRVWDVSLEGLSARVLALKEALNAMGGAQCLQVSEGPTAKKLFYETLPGWTGGHYRGWDLYAMAGRDTDTCFLQDMVPLSSSYSGHMEDGEAIYDGNYGNLAGIRTFANDVPQHSVMIGTTRVGKSSQVIDYMSQTDCFFDFRGIIEEGLSYGTLVKLLDGETIILHPDGEHTINYLDTQGLPLTRTHIAAAAGLLQVMTGKTADSELNTQRKAMLSEYLEQLFNDNWNDYRSRNPDKEIEAARWAVLIERLRRDSTSGYQSLGLEELFSDMMNFSKTDERFIEMMASVSEEEAMAYARRPDTSPMVRDLGLSMLKPEDFRTHTALVEQLKYNRLPHHSKEIVDRMASNLAPWCRHGAHGKLFDGTTNTHLSKRIVHFELGLLPASNTEMKEATVYLISNRIRQRIVTMPRALRKQFIFEEPARYLKVGGMEELFAEFYAQMGKFGCHIMPVTQQYGQLAQSALRPVIFGNSKQFFLFKQNDRHDLNEIGEAIGLPPSAREGIRGFTAPEYQPPGEEKYSQLAVFSQEGDRTDCGVVKNYVTPEMLYVSDSSGARYDAREKALAEYDDILEGVVRETQKEIESRNRKVKKGMAALCKS